MTFQTSPQARQRQYAVSARVVLLVVVTFAEWQDGHSDGMVVSAA